MKLVQRLAIAYLVMDLVHFGDHIRQGRTLTPAVYSLGTIGLVAILAAVVLLMSRYRYAPLLASAVGFATAIGLVAVHLAPRWSSLLSDSYQVLSLDWLSWAIVYLQVAVA